MAWSLLILVQATLAQSQLPSLVVPGGWPNGAKGSVLDMAPARMSSPIVGEFLYLINDRLYLDSEAGRLGRWYLVAEEVQAFGTLPVGSGQQQVLAKVGSEMVTVRWDGTQTNPMVSTSQAGNLPDWKGVKRLWVQERGGTQRVYGYDPGEGKVLRADHTNGVWITRPALPVTQQLRDVQFVELDATHAGEEIVFLTPYQLLILDDSGEVTLEKVAAKASDAIGVFRGPSVGGGDLLVWSHLEGSDYQLRTRSQAGTSAPLNIGNHDCSAILPRKDSLYGDHLLLTRGGRGDVDVVQIVTAAGGEGVALEYPAGGKTFDTHPGEVQRPIRAAATGDFDMDGEPDLALAVMGLSGWEISYVMTQDVHAQTVGWLDASQGVGHEDLGEDQHRWSLPMKLGAQLASSTVLMEVWVIRDPGANQARMERIASEVKVVPVGASEHTFETTLTVSDWEVTRDHVFFSLVPVERNQLQAVTRYFPSRTLGWSHSTASVPLQNAMPTWLNGTGTPYLGPNHRPRPADDGLVN